MNFRRSLRHLLERFVPVEVIGQEECPMMLRWQFLNWGWVKAMVHYFPPEVSDRDPHDHPRSFVTFVLRGNYRDESWDEPGFEARQASPVHIPVFAKLRKSERVRAGMLRFRPAEYMHIVETDEVGCWTLVVMGPVKREWGFRRLETANWLPFMKYIKEYGGVARCDAPPDTMGLALDSAEPGETVEVELPRTARDYKGTTPPAWDLLG